jgi:hypothetical protein
MTTDVAYIGPRRPSKSGGPPQVIKN